MWAAAVRFVLALCCLGQSECPRILSFNKFEAEEKCWSFETDEEKDQKAEEGQRELTSRVG